MKLLLDTHALLWFVAGEADRFSSEALEAIYASENEVWVSAVSYWEVVVKARAGKLDAKVEDALAGAAAAGFGTLGVEIAHLIRLAGLPVHADHKDPFDHLLIAQAIAEGGTFVSQDRNVPRYPVALMRCKA